MKWIIVTILTLVGCMFGSLFYMDVQGVFNPVDVPVAKLRTSNGTVRRLAKNDISWDRAVSGSLFSIGDTISTAEGASATLYVYDPPAEIQLTEGTMLVLGENVKETEINFLTGVAEVRLDKSAKKKLKVTRGIKKKKVVASKPSSPKKASVGSTSETNEEDSRIKVVKVEEIKKEQKPTEEQVRRTNRIIAAQKAPTQKISVEPAAKKGAQQIKPLPAAKSFITSAIEEAEISGQKSILGEKGKILTLDRVVPVPRVTYPPSGKVFSISKKSKAKLRWKLTQKDPEKFLEAKEFEVILKPTSGGRSRLFRTKSNEIVLKGLELGKYKWAVRSVTEGGEKSSISKVRTIELKKKKSKIVRPTVLPVQVE